MAASNSGIHNRIREDVQRPEVPAVSAMFCTAYAALPDVFHGGIRQ
jgi:hypothetical protein